MEQDLEDIIIAGGNDEDIEAAILFHLNLLGDQEGNINNDPQEFNLDDLTAAESKFLFRFEKDDVYRLSQTLRLPDFIRTYKGNKVSGLTSLCMILRRLAYPNRLRDLKNIWIFTTISVLGDK
ncbi:hypothetical protein NQ315_012926 [Exocentrus adspersus]|uniref:Uncharacterized protein n=1 Tax=Exocentrus adspersus TaxID=1586481 RepID=A0AAV8VSK9_9CUCU|nr:hypothetical protein NQ315_012926 [Exocentrus adspersus]